MKSDKVLSRVLRDDGIEYVLEGDWIENQPATNLKILRAKANGKQNWAARVAYNKVFGAVVIQQEPGKGNRLHYHPDSDEMWVILEGSLKWEMEIGPGRISQSVVSKGDIVIVQQGQLHRITVVGTEPAVRLAITRPDVELCYKEQTNGSTDKTT